MTELKELYKKHVDPRVKTNSDSKKIVEAVLPHLEGTGIKIVSSFLNDTEQFWKVNYHWDYLRWMLKDCLKDDNSDKTRGFLKAVLASLEKSKPDPETGYRTSPIGKPEDKSTAEETQRRWLLLRQAKKDWLSIYQKTEVVEKSKKRLDAFKYSASAVAAPGTSKHGHGYALDMKGNHGEIRKIAGYLSASLIFDEDSHVHVEFSRGVASKKPYGAQ